MHLTYWNMTATRHWVIVWQLCWMLWSPPLTKVCPSSNTELDPETPAAFQISKSRSQQSCVVCKYIPKDSIQKIIYTLERLLIFFFFSLIFYSGHQRPKYRGLLLSNHLCFALSLLLAVSLRHTLNKAVVQRQLTHTGILHFLPMGMWLGAEGRDRMLSGFSTATKQEKQYGFSAASRCSWANCRLG